MSGFSTAFTQDILGWVSGDAMAAAPATTYLALFDGDPTNAGSGGTEVTTSVRPAGRAAITWGAASGKTMANSADIDFGNADTGCEVTHAAVFTADTGGTMLVSGALQTPRTIVASDPVAVLTGDLVIGLSG